MNINRLEHTKFVFFFNFHKIDECVLRWLLYKKITYSLISSIELITRYNECKNIRINNTKFFPTHENILQ